MQKRTWRNIRASLSVNVAWDAGELWDIDHEREPLGNLGYRNLAGADELVLDFVSSGYYDPGVLLGAPEDCYPPEHEDERIVTGAYIHFAGGDTLTLSPTTTDRLAQIYEEAIQGVELPDPRDMEPDWDD